MPLIVSVPPVLINGVPYIYARCAAVMRGRQVITERADRVVMGGAKPLVLDLGSGAGARRPAKVIFDRLYLPLAAVNRLFGGDIKWERRERTLVFPAPR